MRVRDDVVYEACLAGMAALPDQAFYDGPEGCLAVITPDEFRAVIEAALLSALVPVADEL